MLVAGVGTSQSVAADAAYRLQMGVLVTVHNPEVHSQHVAAATICLMSFARTPLTERCAVVLVAGSAETQYRLEAMTSRFVNHAVVDALYAALAQRSPERAAKSAGEHVPGGVAAPVVGTYLEDRDERCEFGATAESTVSPAITWLDPAVDVGEQVISRHPSSDDQEPGSGGSDAIERTNPRAAGAARAPATLRGVFLLFGYGRKQKPLGPGGTRTCPRCHNTTQWTRLREYTQLTIFFIPVLRWGRKQLESCGICGAALVV